MKKIDIVFPSVRNSLADGRSVILDHVNWPSDAGSHGTNSSNDLLDLRLATNLFIGLVCFTCFPRPGFKWTIVLK